MWLRPAGGHWPHDLVVHQGIMRESAHWRRECNLSCGDGCCNRQASTESWGGGASLVTRQDSTLATGTILTVPIVTSEVSKGTFLGCYGGQLLDQSQYGAHSAAQVEGHNYIALLTTTKAGGAIYINGGKGTVTTNILREMRHSCEPTTTFERIWTGPVMRLVVQAKMDLPKETELTVDYYSLLQQEGTDCSCGNINCRDRNKRARQS